MPRLGHLLTALAALGVLAALALGGRDDAVAFRLADAQGALSLANSHAGAAIFHGEGLRPGVPVNGSVTIGNTGAAATLTLQAAPESAAPGAGGGRLWDVLTLRISDVTVPATPKMLYDGPVARLGQRALGRFAAGAARTYELTAQLPAATGDAYQGARLSLGLTWVAHGAAPAVTPTPTPVAPASDPNATVGSGALVGLPPATACVKRATLKIKLKRRNGVQVKSIAIRVARRTPLRVSPKARSYVLKRLPGRSRYRVTVTIKLANGRTLRQARTYRACTAAR